MTFLRPLLVGLVVIVAVLALALTVAFTSAFQTWAVRRALQARTDLQGDVTEVSVGLRRVDLTHLRVQGDGYRLAMPSVRIDLPVITAARGRLEIDRLVAKGWTLDLTAAPGRWAQQVRQSPALAGYAAVLAAVGAAGELPAAVTPAEGFAGIFSQLGLPADVAVREAELEGEVIFPLGPGKAPGRARLLLTGGGLRSGADGRFTLVAAVAVDDPAAKVNQLDTRSEVIARMDTPRSFERIQATVVAIASGPQAPNGARLTFDLDARRDAGGEQYGVVFRSAVRTLAELRGVYRGDSAVLSGTWSIDTQSGDLSPFTLGQPLPAFTVTGRGTYAVDRRFAEVQVAGAMQAQAERLEILAAPLASVGLVRLAADFDLAGLGPAIHVKRLSASLSGDAPVARVEALQGFEWDRRTGELRVAAPEQELMRVELQGVPMGWIQPFAGGPLLEGSPLRGEIRALARAGRFSIRTSAPLSVQGLSVRQDGRPIATQLDLRLVGTGDYTPQGWQAELSEVSAQSGGTNLLSLRARLGQALGGGQPVKATGDLQANLGALMRQPFVAEYAALTQGEGRIDYTVTWSDRKELGVAFAFSGLQASDQLLPAFKGEVRADLLPDGRIDVRVPLQITQAERVSDLELVAAIKPVADLQEITAQLTSRSLHVQDVQVLAALVPGGTTSPGAGTSGGPSGPAGPVWQGYTGRLALDLKRVVYSPTVVVHQVVGSVRLGPSALVVEEISAALGEGGMVKLGGQVSFDGAHLAPYALTADLAVNGFDPGPLLRAFNPTAAPPVEGKFDLTTRLAGRSSSLGGLADAASGGLNLSSRGGTLRALSVDLTEYARAGTRLASVAGLIGIATGDQRVLRYSERLKAASELTTDLSAVTFDQLTVQVERTPENHYVIKDLAVISPTLRLLGSGVIEHQPGVSVWSQPLSLNLQLGARDRLAGQLRTLKLLAEQTDALGYSPLVENLVLDGSLENIGTNRFRELLVQALNGT